MNLFNRIKFRGKCAFLLLSVLAFSGCDDDLKDIQGQVQLISSKRTTAQMASRVPPYRTPHQQAFKGYFSDLMSMGLSLKNDAQFAQRFNQAVGQSNLQEMCSKFFFPKSEWQTIMERCTRNRFFLCSEEVRAYPVVVRVFKDHLNSGQRARFEQTPSCTAAL